MGEIIDLFKQISHGMYSKTYGMFTKKIFINFLIWTYRVECLGMQLVD